MDNAERRQLTIMFCDLVGSTTLSAGLDPEDFRTVVRKYHACVADLICAHKGSIAQFLGDGALAYFGYPHADEDDAVQATRAGLALVQAVEHLPTDARTKLRVRIGIATGLVVVGDLSASGELAIGETPNLAARLQDLAEPGMVLIDANSHQLSGDHFEYRDLGSRAIKGFGEPVQAWQVLRNSDVESRFAAMHKATILPLCGREEEMDLLLRRWQSAVRGEGQVVILTGEPGIGKSRIALALEERLQTEAHVTLRYFCSAHHIGSVLAPIIAHLEHSAGFERSNSPAEKLGKLNALIAQSTAIPEHLNVLANLLELPADDRCPPPELPPQERKQKTFAALSAQLAGLAARQPICMIFEDIHWADPTSLELLTATVEHAAWLPVLLLINARPEFTPPWPSYSHVTSIRLARLARSHGAELVERVTGDKTLPKEMADEILTRADGVPLFIEELTKAVLEAGVLREGRQAYKSGCGRLQTIPKTLHGSLLARLDRLGPSRGLAQIGAVIGREFSYELLRAVATLPEPALHAALDRLLASELVYARNTQNPTAFIFKHALIRDVAEDTLLRCRRKELHERIARELENNFPEVVNAQPELIAHHCQEADDSTKAVYYFSIAAERALSRSSLKEAHEHLRKALQLISGLPQSDERRRDELKLKIALARTLLEQNGYADPRVGEAYARAREFSKEMSDSGTYLATSYGLWAHHYIRGELATLKQQADEFLASAESENETGVIVVAHRLLGTTHLIRGYVTAANDALHHALTRYNPDQHGTNSPLGRSLRARFGQDVGVTVFSYLSWALWLVGQPAAAEKSAQAALDRSEVLENDHQSRCYALWHAGMTYVLLRNGDKSAEIGRKLTELATDRELPNWQALGSFLRGFARARQPDEAAELLQTGLRLWTQTGSRVYRPVCLTFLADAYAAGGKPVIAGHTFQKALQIAAETGERWFEPEIHRRLGDLFARYGPPAAAISEYKMAITVAQAQGSKAFELRANTSLDFFLCGRSKEAAAGESLRAADLTDPTSEQGEPSPQVAARSSMISPHSDRGISPVDIRTTLPGTIHLL